jgi:hypothetical protein
MSDIDTSNKFFVASQGDGLRIMNPRALAAGLTKDDALLLAAYLVTMAMATSEEFDAVRTAVEET